MHQTSNFVSGGPVSYQAGAVPTFGNAYSGGLAAQEDQAGNNEWETRFGWRVDVEAASAYLLGPISGPQS